MSMELSTIVEAGASALCALVFMIVPITVVLLRLKRDQDFPFDLTILLVASALSSIAYGFEAWGFATGVQSHAPLWPKLLSAATFALLVVLVMRAGKRGQLVTLAKIRTGQDVMAATPVGILMVDREGVIQDANPAAVALFRYGENLIGLQIEQLIPRRWREHHGKFRSDYALDPQARAMGIGRDLAGLTKDGIEIPIEIALTPLLAEDLVMATVVDITERKRWQKQVEQHTQQLEQSNKELDSFAYVASHDLRSPLRGIQNLSQFIEEDLADLASPEIKSHLAMLRGRIERMDRLLEDLLQYSRVGRGEQRVVNTNVGELIEEVIETLDVPDTFVIEKGEDMPTISTCRTPLEQVFRNLIQNAIKHHNKTVGRVWITSAPDKAGHIEFAVEDDGPGIPPEFRERVFRMFTTLASRDEVEGSGIGLALVRKLVERYGGTVMATDRIGGRGAKFVFTWPSSMAET